MRKFFQDYSVIGVVLIISAIAFGLIFRLLGLSDTSAWGDEIASLFYAENLSEIFQHESHTPFYYFICKLWMSVFGKTIVTLRYLFVFLSFLLMSASSYLLVKNKETGAFLCLVILWWLWPTDIIYSRQARHYGLYAELSFFFLVFWRYRDHYTSKTLFFLGVIIQFLHPFMMIPVWFLAAYDFIREKISRKTLIVTLASSLPLVCYYLFRFLFYGREKVMSNINWIQVPAKTYLKELLLLFGGDSYPFLQFYPLSVSITALFLGCIVAVQLIKQPARESWLKFVLILILSLVITEAFSVLVTNVRIVRYNLYLLPFFLYALIDSVEESKPRQNLIRSSVLLVLLSSYNIFIFRPWSFYEWDDQHVAAAKEMLKGLPPREFVVCGNRYQLDYYFKKPNLTCFEVAFPLLKAKKPFYLFDINGNDKLLHAYILQESNVTFFKHFRHASFIGVDPRR